MDCNAWFRDSWNAYLRKEYKAAYTGFRKILDSKCESIELVNRAFDCAGFMVLKGGSGAGVVAELINECKDRYGELGAMPQYEATLALFAGDMDEFWRSLRRCNPYNQNTMGPWSRGASTLPGSENWRTEWGGSASCFQVVREGRGAGRDVVLFSADKEYFNKYYRFPLESLRKFDTESVIHFHVVNPDEESLKILADLLVEDDCIGVSLESVCKPDKAYFASARFLVAQHVLSLYDRSLFIFDIDVSFNGGVESLFEGRASWDRRLLGVRYTSGLAFPWQKMAAGAMYVPNNESGKDYLKNIERYLGHWFSREKDGDDIWWVDQNAIFFSFLEHVGRGRDYQVWGNRLSLLNFPRLFEDRAKSLMRP